MKVITFPVQFAETDYRLVKDAAKKAAMPVKEFILKAIQDKVNSENNKQK